MADKLLKDHAFWMGRALEMARRAEREDEVPVGAILVVDNKAIAKAYNKKEGWKTPLGHAELICLHRASQKLGRWRLNDAILYVTLEPCAMCAGALVQARIKTLVFAAADAKAGAAGSIFQIAKDARLNHRCEIVSGILADESSELLSSFFRRRRKEKAAKF